MTSLSIVVVLLLISTALSYKFAATHTSHSLKSPLNKYNNAGFAPTSSRQQLSCVYMMSADSPLKVIIAGAPASGKGTQCEFIKEEFGLVHLSTGDILRYFTLYILIVSSLVHFIFIFISDLFQFVSLLHRRLDLTSSYLISDCVKCHDYLRGAYFASIALY
jgi:hypothetical protein